MARGSRRYRLLCPIARALDHVGDRWTLLVLRDLYAGPARFTDLHAGLPGLATNLLTTRLRQLEDDGLVRRRDTPFGVTVYELTSEGRRIRDLLFELAAFGGRFPPDHDVRRPANLRTMVVTLEVACQRVVEPELALRAELTVDGEVFGLVAEGGVVTVSYGPLDEPEVTMNTSYEPLMAAGDGRLPLDELVSHHVRATERAPGKLAALTGLLARAMTALQRRAEPN